MRTPRQFSTEFRVFLTLQVPLAVDSAMPHFSAISRQLLWFFRKMTTWYFISKECLIFFVAPDFRRTCELEIILN